jgi:hypothetical protein
MLFRKTLAAALLCALALPAFAADDAAKATTVKWELPWKAGTSIEYAVENTVDDATKEKPQRTRGTSTNVVSITQARADGFVQTWSERDATYRVLEGDKSAEAFMAALAESFKGIAIEVDLDAAGNYTRLRNLEAISPVMREAVRKAIAGGAEAELAKIPDAAKREEMRKASAGKVDEYLARMTSPQVLETMLAREISWYNAFVGIDIEPDTEYSLDTELPNPFNGPAFPAKLTFSLSVSADDPEDLYVVFQQDIDREKGTVALKHVMKTVFPNFTDADLKDLVLSLKDEGLFVVNRKTGIIEMFENKRTTDLLGKQKIERMRMRQVNGAHDHVWRDETAEADESGGDTGKADKGA